VQALLDAHNQARAAHCAPPLSWSPAVAASAQAWADQLRANGCAFAHSQTAYGENLAAGTAGSLSAESVVGMWYREVGQYDFQSGRFAMETGHFTQVVWKASRSLGCGRSTCKGLDIWVCQYDPPGNVMGGFRTNVVPTSCQ
jgi:pathogenesis-related protein 1